MTLTVSLIRLEDEVELEVEAQSLVELKFNFSKFYFQKLKFTVCLPHRHCLITLT
jgi:hypothetical protein